MQVDHCKKGHLHTDCLCFHFKIFILNTQNIYILERIRNSQLSSFICWWCFFFLALFSQNLDTIRFIFSSLVLAFHVSYTIFHGFINEIAFIFKTPLHTIQWYDIHLILSLSLKYLSVKISIHSCNLGPGWR